MFPLASSMPVDNMMCRQPIQLVPAAQADAAVFFAQNAVIARPEMAKIEGNKH
jgi:hypothetical protein